VRRLHAACFEQARAATGSDAIGRTAS